MNARAKLVWLSATGLVLSLGLSGCGNFFITENSTGTGTGGGTGGTPAGGGNFVYVANTNTDSISGFAVGTGTLTSVPNMPVNLGFTPLAEVVSRNNQFLYVAGPGAIYVYTINANGSLTPPASGSGASIVTANSLDVSPDGQWLLALDQFNAALDVYQIDTAGGLALHSQLSINVASGITVLQKMVKVSPKGSLVFAALGTGGVGIYALSTAGQLTAEPFLPPVSAQTSDNALAIDSTSTHLYVAKSGVSGGLWAYTIGSGGSLSTIAGSPFPAGAQPLSVVLDNSGKYAYVANGTDNTISGYSLETTGVPVAFAGSPYPSGSSVRSLAADRSGSYILAAASGGSPDLTMYSFDATTPGKLISASTATAGTDPAGSLMVVATHP